MKAGAILNWVEVVRKKRAAMPSGVIVLLFLVFLSGCSPAVPQEDRAQLHQQVLKTERAFAHTMKVRDFHAFTSFLSDEAVFSQYK